MSSIEQRPFGRSVKRLWFIVPAYYRLSLTKICLRLLLETCRRLNEYDLEASAVVIADDENLDVADELGFATVRRGNEFVGRKFNDGYQLACDPEFNDRPADFVVPCGSDDWIDPIIFKKLPANGKIGIFRRLAHVDEKREKLAMVRMPFLAGCGVRIIPCEKIAAAGYRPCEEDRQIALDSSTMSGMKRANGSFPPLEELDVHPLQIVDWKSSENQLHSYSDVAPWRKQAEESDPFETLAGYYPAWALEAMRSLP